ESLAGCGFEDREELGEVERLDGAEEAFDDGAQIGRSEFLVHDASSKNENALGYSARRVPEARRIARRVTRVAEGPWVGRPALATLSLNLAFPRSQGRSGEKTEDSCW